MNFGDSWKITKVCFKVLMEEKMLVLFPLISMLATGLILMVLFGGVILAQISSDLLGGSGLFVYLFFSFLYFLLMYTVAIFSNVAIIGCVKIKLEGGKPTFKDGIDLATERIGSIILWALVAATVGLILQIIRSTGKIGEIVANIMGLGWNILTYFVVPVIAYESVGPFNAISRSKDILKKTWGEALVSNISMGLIFFLICLPVFFVLFFIVITAAATGSLILVLGALGLIVLVLITLWAIHTALKAILMTALYKYATTGDAGFGISDNTMRNLFKAKGKGRRRLF